MTITFPVSLEDKRKLSLNYVKDKTKIQRDKNDYPEGRDLGNEKSNSKF